MQKKKGVSLIVLVITIIVMIVLAGAVIISLNNSGIIERANTTKTQYNDKEYETQIKVAMLNYEVDKRNDSSMTLENSMKASLENAFGDTVTVEKENKSITINFASSDLSYRILPNGKVRRLMDVTDVYYMLDEDNVLYLRATPKSGYSIYKNINSVNKGINPVKVVIEEPIAPSTGESMFYPFSNLLSIENIENLHTENMTSMATMFFGCSKLKELDLTNFDTSKVTSLVQFVRGCYALDTLDVSSFDTSKVQQMGYAFSDNNMTKLDLSIFDTSSVTYMNNMFQYTDLLFLDISNFNMDNVTNYNNMFTLNYGRALKIKIRAKQAIVDILMDKFTFLKQDNFEIVN